MDLYNQVFRPKGELYLSDKYIPEKPLFRDEQISKLRRFVSSAVLYGTSDVILLEGPSGTGKTMSYRIVERDLSQDLTDTKFVYVNARDKTLVEILMSILSSLGFSCKRGFSYGYYLSSLENYLRTSGIHVHVCIDEVDKVRETRGYSLESLL